MGKKRDRANAHIETLIDELVAYEEAYVGSDNCPYKFDLFGSINIKKPELCDDCTLCKKDFFEEVTGYLLETYIVK